MVSVESRKSTVQVGHRQLSLSSPKTYFLRQEPLQPYKKTPTGGCSSDLHPPPLTPPRRTSPLHSILLLLRLSPHLECPFSLYVSRLVTNAYPF